jgi:hypothetical protein
MKKLFAVIGVVAFLATISCSQTSKPAVAQNEGASIEFEATTHNFGTIPQGGDGTYEFAFKNTGKEPLLLTNVRSSCGCTVPEWPKNPINKGEEAKIKIRYNTKITGTFSKSISVYSNAGETPIVLVIKGKVEAAKNPKAEAGEKK